FFEQLPGLNVRTVKLPTGDFMLDLRQNTPEMMMQLARLLEQSDAALAARFQGRTGRWTRLMLQAALSDVTDRYIRANGDVVTDMGGDWITQREQIAMNDYRSGSSDLHLDPGNLSGKE